MNKKSLLTLLSVVVISAIVLTGTLAYLQDKSVTVKNEFDKHTVYVDLDENGDGQYDIIPGTSEDKDPKVTVTTDIDSYVFLEVDDKTQGVVEYAIANGWLPLTYVDEEGDTVTVDGVYYRILDVSETDADTDTTDKYSFYVLKNNVVTYSSELTNDDIDALTGKAFSLDNSFTRRFGDDSFTLLSSASDEQTSKFTPISVRISLRRGEDDARTTFALINQRISRFLPKTFLKSADALIASLTSSEQSLPSSVSVLTITLSPRTSQLMPVITPLMLLSKLSAMRKITLSFLIASTSSSVRLSEVCLAVIEGPRAVPG